MEELLELVRKLREEVGNLVDLRMKEFQELGRRPSREMFKELCFCILTANFSAERSIRIQKEIDDGFLMLPEPELAGRLRALGHRYPEARARYIVLARRYSDSLKEILSAFGSGAEAREWLVRNIKGIGYKEASHFLRNVGYMDLAIVDFHIIDILVRHKLVERPKTLTKRRYLETEALLREIAHRSGITLAELDLYLWYSETGKVLK